MNKQCKNIQIITLFAAIKRLTHVETLFLTYCQFSVTNFKINFYTHILSPMYNHCIAQPQPGYPMNHALQATALTFIIAINFLISSLILYATYDGNLIIILAINILITYLTKRHMRKLFIQIILFFLKKILSQYSNFFSCFFSLLMRECTKHP